MVLLLLAALAAVRLGLRFAAAIVVAGTGAAVGGSGGAVAGGAASFVAAAIWRRRLVVKRAPRRRRFVAAFGLAAPVEAAPASVAVPASVSASTSASATVTASATASAPEVCVLLLSLVLLCWLLVRDRVLQLLLLMLLTSCGTKADAVACCGNINVLQNIGSELKFSVL